LRGGRRAARWRRTSPRRSRGPTRTLEVVDDGARAQRIGVEDVDRALQRVVERLHDGGLGDRADDEGAQLGRLQREREGDVAVDDGQAGADRGGGVDRGRLALRAEVAAAWFVGREHAAGA
jgi:hypothetical protein